jgi:transposase
LAVAVPNRQIGAPIICRLERLYNANSAKLNLMLDNDASHGRNGEVAQMPERFPDVKLCE